MAWLAVGTNNDDLVNQLIQNEVLHDSSLIKAFRLTDRGDFVQQKYRSEAYHDRPFKRDFVHISAPHMYVTVLSALDVRPGHAFLNIGSGSGYLSCLVACLLGEGGVSHGIDCNLDVVIHSVSCCDRWYKAILDTKYKDKGSTTNPFISVEGVQFVTGNCFDLDMAVSDKQCKYDRIYIGGGCPKDRVKHFYSLLAEDGVLVAPFDDSNELVKIHRVCGDCYTTAHISHVNFAPLIPNIVLSSVSNQVVLPTLLWTPFKSRHKQFPPTFREIVRMIILGQPQIILSGSSSTIVHCNLPTAVWYIVFSYCPRDWFIPNRSTLELTLKELAVERELRMKAEDRIRRIEGLRIAAEHERDAYRVIVAQMRQENTRLQTQSATTSNSSGSNGGSSLSSSSLGIMSAVLGLAGVGIGVGGLSLGLTHQYSDSSDEDEDEVEDDEEGVDHSDDEDVWHDMDGYEEELDDDGDEYEQDSEAGSLQSASAVIVGDSLPSATVAVGNSESNNLQQPLITST